VLRSVRSGQAGRSDTPIIVLSGRSGEGDRIAGLDLGADDYLVKPFSPGELAARVRSVLRRSAPDPSIEAVVVGTLRIEPASRRVLLGEEEKELTPKEFDLLLFLATHPRHVFTRAQLVDQVWNSSSEWLGEATVTEHVHRLRLKLESDPSSPRLLRTVRGVGYQLVDA
jgi:two-component system phosphate regulon response regulator PhoB